MRKFVISAMFCLFILQAGIASDASPFKSRTLKSHSVYHAKYIETVANGAIVATHFCMLPVKTELSEYRRIEVEAFSAEVDGADLEARLWHQALMFLLRTEGEKRVHATTSGDISTLLADTMQTSHELYILSPALDSHITYDPIKQQANATYTIYFGLLPPTRSR